MSYHSDTIAAIASANGVGGVGVVRISGPQSHAVAQRMTGVTAAMRTATLADFRDVDGEVLDQGLVLLFAAGASFTGEAVAELQGHGGPVVLKRVLDAVLRRDVRLARPGEFSERAFLNGQIDLAQAEAIADLISSASEAAARGAIASLKGHFSNAVNELSARLNQLRVYVEADIDFPDEEVDVLADGEVARRIGTQIEGVESFLAQAEQGARLTEGASIAIVGAPNVGKSSLLNALTGEQSAIVTDIPGTTRDLLKVDLVIDGVPMRFVDTAGLRETDDPVEAEGVRRAKTALQEADLVIYLRDLSAPDRALPLDWLPDTKRRLDVWNKLDLTDPDLAGASTSDQQGLAISARQGRGIAELAKALAERLGVSGGGAFSARTRHLEQLRLAVSALQRAQLGAQERQGSEMVAEELRLAQEALGDIVGEVTADALLGEIFSTFCIGK